MAQALSKSLAVAVGRSESGAMSATEKYRAGLDAKGRHDTVAGAFQVRHSTAGCG